MSEQGTGLSGDAVLRRGTGVIDAEIDGEVVLMAPTDFSYHGLDEIGSHLWGVLAEPTSVDDLVTRLTSEFDVEPDVCRRDVEAFVVTMRDLGLLEVS